MRIGIGLQSLRPDLALKQDHMQVAERVAGEVTQLLDLLERLFVLQLRHADRDLACLLLFCAQKGRLSKGHLLSTLS